MVKRDRYKERKREQESVCVREREREEEEGRGRERGERGAVKRQIKSWKQLFTKQKLTVFISNSRRNYNSSNSCSIEKIYTIFKF